MAKGYHNLAGLVRDLRNARGDAADGSATAEELLDALDEELELLYERGEHNDARGEDDDGDGSDDAAEDEDTPVPRETGKRLGSVGGGGQRPTVHSTRARARDDAKPSRRRATAVDAFASGEPRPVPSSRNGGKR